MTPRLPMPEEAIAAFCRKHRIRQFLLFGSVLRDDFGPDSDVDVLVAFEPGVRFGYFKLIGMQEELGEILGRRSEMYELAWLKPWMQEEVMKTSESIYESPE